MEEKEVMNPRNTVDGALADCCVVWDGKQYNFMQAIRMSTFFNIIRGDDGSIAGWAGTGTMDFYYCDSVLRRIIARSKESGEDEYFDMLVTNCDPMSQMGKQTVLLKGCRIESGRAALFDVNNPALVDSVNFSFKDFEFKEKFQYAGKSKGKE